MDGDSTPWEVLNQRKLTKEQADAMEGDLTMNEMEDALFNHMNAIPHKALMDLLLII